MGKGKVDLKERVQWCGAYTFLIIAAVIVCLLLGLTIAKIYMGKVYFYSCSLQFLVPVYLVFSGFLPIWFCSFIRDAPDGTYAFCFKYSCGIFGFFVNFAWLICGSVWIYPTYDIVMGGTSKYFCDERLITFAYAAVTIDWLFMGLWIAILAYYVAELVNKKLHPEPTAPSTNEAV